jgi:uncharacterized protein (TIGR02117 family)
VRPAWLRRLLAALITALLSGCATLSPTPTPPPGAAARTEHITVVGRGWHTDICLNPMDAHDSLDLARRFPGAAYLCFGFGERQYYMGRQTGPIEMLSALLPSSSALLVTALRVPPNAAFPGETVDLSISRAGMTGLVAFIQKDVETGSGGNPIVLGPGPYPGSVFWAGRRTYDAFFTCNSWTADGLRAAGLPFRGNALFAGQVMDQVRRLAAAGWD